MIIKNIAKRVLMIRIGIDEGTAFTLENNSCQYIITAKHLFEKVGYSKDFIVELNDGGDTWTAHHAKIYYHDLDVDVAVIMLKDGNDITKKYDVTICEEGVDFGTDLYFLGFPFGYRMGFLDGINERPIPLLKKGILSGEIIEEGKRVHFIDGHNNPGFSGGPVYYLKGTEVYIMGVVSGYRDHLSVLYEAIIEPKLGQVQFQELLRYYVKENSGIVRFFNIYYVTEIFEKINNLPRL